MLWMIVLLISLGLAIILLPYSIFLYETDSEKYLVKRMLRVFFYSLVELSFFADVLFGTWTVLRKTQLPIKMMKQSKFEPTGSDIIVSDAVATDLNIEFDASKFVYGITIWSFAG